MQAVLYREYGTPERVLHSEDRPIPDLSEDEVLVKVKAVGLNPRDINIVAGKLKFVSGKNFPKGIGADFSGVIEKIGAKVNDLCISDPVVGYIDSLDAGAVAEYVAVKAATLSIKPGNLKFDAAAAMPCNYLTAWFALISKAKISKGQSVMIYGASGGVGTAAIQIAKYAGAIVTAVSSQKNLEYCLSHGADHAIPYERADDVFGPAKLYDVFFQIYSDSGLLYDKAKGIIADKGSFVTLIPNPLYLVKKFINLLLKRPGFHYILVKSDQMVLTKLLALAVQGILNPFISKDFGFEEYQSALQALQSGHYPGKLIIKLEE